MTTTIDLPDGQTAVLKDNAELTNKEAKALRRSARIAAAIAVRLENQGFKDADPESWRYLADLTDEEDSNLDLFQRQCIFTRLVLWSLERDLPATIDAVDDLPRPIYVPLAAAASDIKLTDDFTVDSVADPKADTEGSES